MLHGRKNISKDAMINIKWKVTVTSNHKREQKEKKMKILLLVTLLSILQVNEELAGKFSNNKFNKMLGYNSIQNNIF